MPHWAGGCKRPAHSCYSKVQWPGVKPRPQYDLLRRTIDASPLRLRGGAPRCGTRRYEGMVGHQGTSHSSHPAKHYTYSLNPAPYLARPMLSCSPVKECTLLSRTAVQCIAPPAARPTCSQCCPRLCPVPPTPHRLALRETKNANFLAP